MARILIVEDHQGLSTLISQKLRHDHVFDQAFTLEQAQFFLDTVVYDLLILDLSLPDGDGLVFAQNLDGQTNSPALLFLTAETDLTQKLACLRINNSDYLSKPFHFAELRARIEALLQVSQRKKTDRQLSNSLLVHGAIVLNIDSHDVMYHRHKVHLNRKEFLLLKLFLENPDRIFSKEVIINQVWSDDTALFSNSLATTIASLRRKFGKTIIVTMKSQGYLLRSH